MLYGTLNSFMRSGKAGINIVSAYMTIVARLLRTASTFHADIGIFVVGGPPGLSSKVPKQMSPSCPCNGLNYLIKRCGKEKHMGRVVQRNIVYRVLLILSFQESN
jgi:hypothetical protein